MIQTAVEYNKPQVEEKVNYRVDGVLTKIIWYEFSSHSESVPGSDHGRSGMKTTRKIFTDYNNFCSLMFGFKSLTF